MEHVDNDMDDLFQKAGENYPLETTGSDWDAVAGKLRNESFSDMNIASSLTSGRNRNKRRWLFLLLLIPLGLEIAFMTGALDQKNFGNGSVKPASAGINATITPTEVENKPGLTNETSAGNTSEKSGNESFSVPKIINGESAGKINMHSVTAKTKFYSTSDRNLATKNIQKKQRLMIVGDKANNTNLNVENENKNSSESKTLNSVKLSVDPSPADAESTVAKSATSVIPVAVAEQKEKVTVNKNTDSAVIEKALSQDGSTAKKKSVVNAKHSKGFYAGLLLGPDISTVKFQSVKQLGYSVGFLVGYRFNDMLALETGLLYDKKFYYTNGEYFKKENGYYYPSSNTLNGNCDMLEIPLTLRFDFKKTKDGGFFVKAGLSTYVMMRQYYVQDSSGIMNGGWPVTKTTSYPFSIVTLSGGYEFSINSKTRIQIEPYFKIPLQGLGEGDLPISSVGIYFGITHSFH